MHNSTKTLTIGNETFPSILVQGPLAGYSCAPMRVQTWRYSQPAYCSTEMLSASHLVHAKQQPKRFTYKHPEEGPLCIQMAAHQVDVLAKATRKFEAMGAQMIELNCGCPVQKIRSKGSGSKLLSDPEKLRLLVRAMRDNTDALVSVKIRVAKNPQDSCDLEIAHMIESEGADCLVVHGRHWTERYDVPCQFDKIAAIVKAVSIPVLGNGDVHDLDSLKAMLSTGCAGVMIARASVGQPWLFEQLSAGLQGRTYEAPSTAQVGEIFIDHIHQLAQLDSPYRAVLQARTMGKYYARDRLRQRPEFIAQLNQCDDLNHFTQMVQTYFQE